MSDVVTNGERYGFRFSGLRAHTFLTKGERYERSVFGGSIVFRIWQAHGLRFSLRESLGDSWATGWQFAAIANHEAQEPQSRLAQARLQVAQLNRDLPTALRAVESYSFSFAFSWV